MIQTYPLYTVPSVNGDLMSPFGDDGPAQSTMAVELAYAMQAIAALAPIFPGLNAYAIYETFTQSSRTVNPNLPVGPNNLPNAVPSEYWYKYDPSVPPTMRVWTFQATIPASTARGPVLLTQDLWSLVADMFKWGIGAPGNFTWQTAGLVWVPTPDALKSYKVYQLQRQIVAVGEQIAPLQAELTQLRAQLAQVLSQ